MPSHERVASLISYAEQGRVIEAIQEFYAEGATVQENSEPRTVGLAAILEREQAFLEMIAEVHENRAASFLVEGDRAAINWVIDITNKQGQRVRFDEIAYQTWQGDKIVEERFFYNPALPAPA